MSDQESGEVTIDVTPFDDGEGVRVRTAGMARVGHPELEIVRVPEAQAEVATAVVDVVARYVGQQQVVAAGERIEIRGPRAALVVGFEAAPDEGKKKKGFFGRLLGGGRPAVLRLVEPDDSMEHAKTLLSTLVLWRAASLVGQDQAEEAKAALLRSVDDFPGDPARREAPQLGVPYNWENHLSYALLAQLDEERAEEWLAKAFQRADTLELECLGDDCAELAKVSREELLETASTIVDHNLEHVHLDDETPGVVVLTSPIWLHFAEEDGMSAAERTITVLPESCADYYYRGAVAERLKSDELQGIAVDALRAHLERPPRLAALVDEVQKLYASGEDEQMTDESTPHYAPGAQVLSLLLADAGRRLAAGLTPDELRASYGLAEEAELGESAARKMSALAEAERAAFRAMDTEEEEDAEEDEDAAEEDEDATEDDVR